LKTEEIKLKEKQFCNVVVYNITSDYSTEEIKNSCFDERGNWLEVLNVTRLKRKVTNQMLESKSVVLILKQQTPPRKVFVMGNQKPIKIYKEKPMQCKKYFLFGHTENRCLAAEIFCTRCSEKDYTETICTKSAFCKNCKGAHKPTETTNCKAYVKRCQILRVAETQQIPIGLAAAMMKELPLPSPTAALKTPTSLPPIQDLILWPLLSGPTGPIQKQQQKHMLTPRTLPLTDPHLNLQP